MIRIEDNCYLFVQNLIKKQKNITTFLFEDCFDQNNIPKNLQIIQNIQYSINNLASLQQPVDFVVCRNFSFCLTIYHDGQAMHRILEPTLSKAICGWRLIHHDF
jgi:hypothetical protein